MQKYTELDNRGVRERSITEIIPENVVDCKKLMKFQEVRRPDGLKGYLAIAEGRMLVLMHIGKKVKYFPCSRKHGKDIYWFSLKLAEGTR